MPASIAVVIASVSCEGAVLRMEKIFAFVLVSSSFQCSARLLMVRGRCSKGGEILVGKVVREGVVMEGLLKSSRILSLVLMNLYSTPRTCQFLLCRYLLAVVRMC